MHEFPPEFETADTKTKIVYRLDKLWHEFDQTRQELAQHLLLTSEVLKTLENVREEYLPVDLRVQNSFKPQDFSDPRECYFWCEDDWEKLYYIFFDFLEQNENIGLDTFGKNNWLKEMWDKTREEVKNASEK